MSPVERGQALAKTEDMIQTVKGIQSIKVMVKYKRSRGSPSKNEQQQELLTIEDSVAPGRVIQYAESFIDKDVDQLSGIQKVCPTSEEIGVTSTIDDNISQKKVETPTDTAHKSFKSQKIIDTVEEKKMDSESDILKMQNKLEESTIRESLLVTETSQNTPEEDSMDMPLQKDDGENRQEKVSLQPKHIRSTKTQPSKLTDERKDMEQHSLKPSSRGIKIILHISSHFYFKSASISLHALFG